MKKVLLIDSGSGGVNILKECVKVCPYCDFLLFCDDKNLPYGNKSVELLQQITIENLKNIQKFFPFDIVILACNTLSCTCLERVRAEFENIIFIGTVPAVKPALEKWQPNEVLVLATENTIKNNILINKNKEVVCKSVNELAGLIDQNLDNLEGLKPFLQKNLGEMSKPKAIVLGCTHYLAIKPQLRQVFGGDVEFFDGANGVARRLSHFVFDDEDAKATTPNFQVQIVASGNENMLPVFWWWYEKDT